MELLSKDKLFFEQIIRDIYNKMDIVPEYIEKDYYALSILKELVKKDPNFVFKGGTSLSVCHHLINRFSEDIDISYPKEHITVGERKRIKNVFVESINSVLSIENLDNIRSRRIFNRYLCPYESAFSKNKDRVIVEWSTQTPAFPIEESKAQTIIGKYLASINRFDLIEKYDLGEFNVITLKKERTLADKVYAICDYHISKSLDRQSRHIYDIHKLMECVELNYEWLNLFIKVGEYRVKLDTCYSLKENKRISELLQEIIDEKTFYNDFRSRTQPLLYDGLKYEVCISSVKIMCDYLRKHNL